MKLTYDKVFALADLLPRLERERAAGRTLVFTNGCFDILHVGHVRLLQQAKAEGDVLIVAINADASVRRLNKGDDRPIHPEAERAETLAAFAAVDYVTVFDEPTPQEIIVQIQPDVLVKGGDWGPDEIVGSDTVQARGGRVLRVDLVRGQSTTNLLKKARGED
ncbi:MAG TPA: D-glycero-beta-D-manno-heptose 1-phosphate adenylyltransferase [bacterium]|nr:D-glycero-beta-D-manno-heptose 1-phosphate adenylyltransferase [bacterium]